MKYLVRFLAAVGALSLLLVALLVIALSVVGTGKKPVPEAAILELDLEQQLVEYVPEDPVAKVFSLAEEQLTVRQVTEALQRAQDDPRVVGIYARVGAARMGMAVIQELRDAIIAFHSAGKFAVAHAETFGEFGPGSGSYYLATSFKEIYLQPSGDLGLTGIMYESPFLKGAMDRWHLKPRLSKRNEYKNAANLFTEDSYTDAHRESVSTLMNAQILQLVDGIGQARGMAADEVTALMERAPLSSRDALDGRLIDGLHYRDDVADMLKQRSQGGEFIDLNEFLRRIDDPIESGPVIALVYGTGQVHRGKSDFNPLGGSPSMGSSTVTKAVRDAVEEADVKAIVFRVDSPGGSYVASDAIWRELRQAREAEKPVIVSMGNVAASGGYFVSMPANKIVAQPGTITGSIGVLAGKLVTGEFWKRHLGVTWDEVHTNRNATMWTGVQDYTPQQLEKLEEVLDRIYLDFTGKVAVARQLTTSQVEAVAGGRIWSGSDALSHGLVDTLGGLELAVRLAGEEAGLDPQEPFTLRVYPRPKPLLEQLLERLDTSTGAQTTARQLAAIIKPLARVSSELEEFHTRAALQIPRMEPRW
jgi:protease-4